MIDDRLTRPGDAAEMGQIILVPTTGARGLLFDRQSGALYHLNEVAALIWLHALEGKPPVAIAEAVSATFGITREIAERDVRTALQLSPGRPLADPPGPYLFERTSLGHQFSLKEHRLFSIESNGQRLSLLTSSSDPHLALHLLNLAPKLLALQGVTVLHA